MVSVLLGFAMMALLTLIPHDHGHGHSHGGDCSCEDDHDHNHTDAYGLQPFLEDMFKADVDT